MSTFRGRSGPGAAPPTALASGCRARTISTKRSNRWWLSVGPGQPSGWYWTLNTGSERWARPSTEPSLRLTWVTWKSPSGTLAASTWNSWFWLVMWTAPVASSLTGWLAPWWPNGRRDVVAPTARPRIWWPRQMPNSGMRPIASRHSSTGPSRTAGSPGPLASSRPSAPVARTSSHVAVWGSTTTRQVRWRSERRMFHFTP